MRHLRAPRQARRGSRLFAQSFATESFGLILSEARKYALTLTIAHQYLGQLPDTLREAVFGNVGSILAARVGGADAPALAAELDLESPNAISDLPNFAAWARLLQCGVPSSPIRLSRAPAPLPRRPDTERLRETSRGRFGRPRAMVEERIARFLAPGVGRIRFSPDTCRPSCAGRWPAPTSSRT